MSDRKIKNGIKYYSVALVAIITGVIYWANGHPLAAGILLAAGIPIVISLTCSLATYKRQCYLANIDIMPAWMFYEHYVVKKLTDEGLVQGAVKADMECVYADWYDSAEKCIRVIAVIKKDYIRDKDIDGDRSAGCDCIWLYTNSYFRGTRDILVKMDRKSLRKIYKEEN